MLFDKQNKIKNVIRGFTLVELLVTISIFMLITSVVLVKNQQFNNSILITNLSYEIALSIREAQSFGINVKGSAQYDLGSGFGVHFDVNNPGFYYLFAGESFSDLGIIDTYTITKGNRISKLCIGPIGDGESCSSLIDNQLKSVDITFKRPNPDAVIKTDTAGTVPAIRIHVSSPQGAERIIDVQSTGQISIVQQ